MLNSDFIIKGLSIQYDATIYYCQLTYPNEASKT